jgi:hypothetical protein
MRPTGKSIYREGATYWHDGEPGFSTWRGEAPSLLSARGTSWWQVGSFESRTCGPAIIRAGGEQESDPGTPYVHEGRPG